MLPARIKAPSASAGFTLVELMVSMVIVAFFSGLLVISIGDSFHRELKKEAERFQIIVNALTDEALFSSQELGLYLNDNSYDVLVFDKVNRQWVPLQNSAFKRYELSEVMKLSWLVEGEEQDASEDVIKPQILFFSSGESNVYTVSFSSRDNPTQHTSFEVRSDGFTAPLIKEISK